MQYAAGWPSRFHGAVHDPFDVHVCQIVITVGVLSIGSPHPARVTPGA